MKLTDDELDELYDILTDASIDDYHGTSDRSEEAQEHVRNLVRKVNDEAKQRKLWWAQ